MKELFIEITKERRTIFALAMAVFLALQGVSAPAWGWTGPTAAPPSGDVSAPIYGSSGSQTRSGPLTIAGNLTTQRGLLLFGDYLDFGEDTKTIRRSSNYIALGTAATAFFKFFVTGTYAGRFAIGNPASDSPPTNLYVGGTGYLAGNTSVDGTFTMSSGANVCKMVYYDLTTESECGANYYAVGATDTSFVIQNPASPTQTGYVICCKNAD